MPSLARGVSQVFTKVSSSCLPPAALISSDLPPCHVPKRPQRVIVELAQRVHDKGEELDAEGVITLVVLAVLRRERQKSVLSFLSFSLFLICALDLEAFCRSSKWIICFNKSLRG